MVAISVTLALSLAICWCLAERLKRGNRILEARIDHRDERHSLSRRPPGAQRSNERVFETVLRDMREGVLVIGARGEFLLENPALTRVASKPTKRDADPADWPELFGAFDPRTGEHLREDQLILPKSLRGESCEIDVLFRNESNPEGSHVHGRSQPIRDDQGVIRGAVGFFRDVTASKRAEVERVSLIADLERRNTGLERFNDAVSNDLRHALVSIKESLIDLEHSVEVGDREQAENDIDRIGTAVAEMKLLLDELLELSRASHRTDSSPSLD